MLPDDLTIALTFNQDVRGGVEPAGTTIDVRVTADGFFDVGGLGAAGQSTEPIPIERLAETLLQHYESERLHAVLDRIVGLRAAIR